MLYLLLLIYGLLTTGDCDNIGYFWHITDLHWDNNYSNSDCRGQKPEMFGVHNCDSSWKLIESAVQFMRKEHGEDIEFVLWTGDGLRHKKRDERRDMILALQNITHLFSQTFPNHFVFPVLGHDDEDFNVNQKISYRDIASLWSHWLPLDALSTFSKGGFYTIEQKIKKLRIIALNTNMFVSIQEPAPDQWKWLEDTLQRSLNHNETVYLVGHMPPGMDERRGTRPMMANTHNTRYINLVKRYADIITGQFFGHLHSDTFRIIYNDTGFPVSSIFIAPSVTPKRSSSGINNPGLRLYKIDKNTGQIMDYFQYYMDITSDNKDSEAHWALEYNLADYYSHDFYSLGQVSALKLHHLVENFTIPEAYSLFWKYYLANSVSSCSVRELILNAQKPRVHYCAITNVEISNYFSCLASDFFLTDSAVYHQPPPASLFLSILILLILASHLENFASK